MGHKSFIGEYDPDGVWNCECCGYDLTDDSILALRNYIELCILI